MHQPDLTENGKSAEICNPDPGRPAPGESFKNGKSAENEKPRTLTD
ncbi:unnamed protein product [marine sediment metagenome]|uniref:Uncharacterized protein n=1 Tax=marine sediment metagenome TaxID=412755 RepID=X1QXW5_9ZZZZ